MPVFGWPRSSKRDSAGAGAVKSGDARDQGASERTSASGTGPGSNGAGSYANGAPSSGAARSLSFGRTSSAKSSYSSQHSASAAAASVTASITARPSSKDRSSLHVAGRASTPSTPTRDVGSPIGRSSAGRTTSIKALLGGGSSSDARAPPSLPPSGPLSYGAGAPGSQRVVHVASRTTGSLANEGGARGALQLEVGSEASPMGSTTAAATRVTATLSPASPSAPLPSAGLGLPQKLFRAGKYTDKYGTPSSPTHAGSASPTHASGASAVAPMGLVRTGGGASAAGSNGGGGEGLDAVREALVAARSNGGGVGGSPTAAAAAALRSTGGGGIMTLNLSERLARGDPSDASGGGGGGAYAQASLEGVRSQSSPRGGGGSSGLSPLSNGGGVSPSGAAGGAATRLSQMTNASSGGGGGGVGVSTAAAAAAAMGGGGGRPFSGSGPNPAGLPPPSPLKGLLRPFSRTGVGAAPSRMSGDVSHLQHSVSGGGGGAMGGMDTQASGGYAGGAGGEPSTPVRHGGGVVGGSSGGGALSPAQLAAAQRSMVAAQQAALLAHTQQQQQQPGAGGGAAGGGYHTPTHGRRLSTGALVQQQQALALEAQQLQQQQAAGGTGGILDGHGHGHTAAAVAAAMMGTGPATGPRSAATFALAPGSAARLGLSPSSMHGSALRLADGYGTLTCVRASMASNFATQFAMESQPDMSPPYHGGASGDRDRDSRCGYDRDRDTPTRHSEAAGGGYGYNSERPSPMSPAGLAALLQQAAQHQQQQGSGDQEPPLSPGTYHALVGGQQQQHQQQAVAPSPKGQGQGQGQQHLRSHAVPSVTSQGTHSSVPTAGGSQAASQHTWSSSVPPEHTHASASSASASPGPSTRNSDACGSGSGSGSGPSSGVCYPSAAGRASAPSSGASASAGVATARSAQVSATGERDRFSPGTPFATAGAAAGAAVAAAAAAGSPLRRSSLDAPAGAAAAAGGVPVPAYITQHAQAQQQAAVAAAAAQHQQQHAEAARAHAQAHVQAAQAQAQQQHQTPSPVVVAAAVVEYERQRAAEKEKEREREREREKERARQQAAHAQAQQAAAAATESGIPERLAPVSSITATLPPVPSIAITVPRDFDASKALGGDVNEEHSAALPGYTVGKVVGEGGFCQVRLGVHHLSGRKIAVKIIDKTKLADMNEAKRIQREIRVMRHLSHECIIKLFEVIESPTRLYLVMEHAPSGSLLDYVRSRKRLSEQDAIYIFQQLVAGLEYCHRREVVHRDVKLENILLDADNRQKIIDFGLSAFYIPGKRLRVHCGSPSYAAPEIVARKSYDGPPVDVWSLGVVLFAMLAGFLPFHSSSGNKQELCQKIMDGKYNAPDYLSSHAKDLLARMLTVDPEKRITFEQVWSHPWVRCGPRWDPIGLTVFMVRADPGSGTVYADEQVLVELEQRGYPRSVVLQHMLACECNYMTAAYCLLAEARAEATTARLRASGVHVASSQALRRYGSGSSRAQQGAAAPASGPAAVASPGAQQRPVSRPA